MIDISNMIAVNDKERKQNAKPIIGWLYDQVPVELVYAAGLQPFHLAGKKYSTNYSDEFFPNFFCPYATSILEGCLSDQFENLGGVIFTNSCNALEKVCDIWRDQKPSAQIYMLDVPRKYSDLSIKFFQLSILKLKRFLEETFQIQITDHGLWESIRLTNNINALIGELGQSFGPAVNGLSYAQFLNIIAAGSNYSQMEYYDRLLTLKAEIAGRIGEKKRSPSILLVGSMVPDSRFISIIEAAGMTIISEDLSMGKKRWGKCIREDIEPLAALAEVYLTQSNTTRMTDGCAMKISKYLELYEQLKFDGVIYLSLRFCINHSYDYMEVKHSFEQMGVPVLFIECDYSGSGLEQIKTRIQAFAEML